MATSKSSTKKTTTVRKTTTKKPATKKAPVKKVAKTTRSAATTKRSTASKSKKITQKTAPANKTKQGNHLKKLLVVGLLILLGAAAAVVASGNNMNVSVTTHYLAENRLAAEQQLLPAATQLFDLNVKYLIAGGLVLAALWRLLLLTKLAKRYQRQLSGNFTSLNWVELSVLAPFVFLVIGLLVGVRDLASLLLLLAIPAATSVLGYLSDRYSMLQNGSWLKTKIALDALFLPWLIIGMYVLHTYVYGFVEFSAGVYALLVAGFILYSLLAVVHKKQILAEGRFSDFIYGEKWIASLHVLVLIVVAALAFV